MFLPTPTDGSDKYIIVITKAQPIGRLCDQTIYRVVSTQLLPLCERAVRDPDEDAFVALLEVALRAGPMYFSYSIDLTSSFQRQSRSDPAQPLWMRTDDRFFWNRFVQADLIELRTRGSRANPGPQPAADPFILPVIFGMAEIRPTTFCGTPLTFVLISRRSRHRVGTRFFTRGLDPDGNAANYNETEQVIILNDNPAVGDRKETQYFSFIQTRGSVPTLWAEINNLGYAPRLQIRSVDAAVAPARRHLDEQVRLYGDNYLVNLVNQKGREARVKESYEQIFERITGAGPPIRESDQLTSEKFTTIPSDSRLHYIYFDYHSETKALGIDRAYAVVDRLAPALDSYFSAVEMPGRSHRLEPQTFQTAVVRTNCMDCLDRTNVVQSMLARTMLDRILRDNALLPTTSTFATKDPAFELLFRNVWADNADAISRAYAGTGAMKTDVTRTGTRTKAGMMQDVRISITRYLKNNFMDGPRQDALDLFLGAHHPTVGVFADRRPASIQAVPYLLAFAMTMILVGLSAPTSLAMRVFILCWVAVAAWCGSFIFRHGMLYVSLHRVPYSSFLLLTPLGHMAPPCPSGVCPRWY